MYFNKYLNMFSIKILQNTFLFQALKVQTILYKNSNLIYNMIRSYIYHCLFNCHVCFLDVKSRVANFRLFKITTLCIYLIKNYQIYFFLLWICIIFLIFIHHNYFFYDSFCSNDNNSIVDTVSFTDTSNNCSTPIIQDQQDHTDTKLDKKFDLIDICLFFVGGLALGSLIAEIYVFYIRG